MEVGRKQGGPKSINRYARYYGEVSNWQTIWLFLILG